MAHPTEAVAPTPEVLELGQGERRVRRGSRDSTAVTILKVDGRNGGSPDLVMGYELIAPGRTIMPHRHLVADEIIFVHEGSGIAEVGELKKPFGTGATIYIPRNVRVSVHNTGAVPLAVAFFFSKPGFEAYLRDTSVPEGQPIPPLSSEELAAIRARHRWHVVYEQP
jgi:mannose-6-phosphate isomerase-like protein (cupin superfamily)